MKDLKSKEGKVIRMYSFENQQEYDLKGRLTMFSSPNKSNVLTILFSGTKSELLEKDESFWEGIVARHPQAMFPDSILWKNYNGLFWSETAKESGHSATNSEPGEWKLITQESI